MSDTWHVIGIDPAPRKPAVICEGDRFETVPPQALAEFIRRRIKGEEHLLIAWDAPLSFDGTISYSDRPIDKAVRAFIANEPRLKGGAVYALPFSGCPHWAITCDVLGLPIGGERGVQLVAEGHEPVAAIVDQCGEVRHAGTGISSGAGG